MSARQWTSVGLACLVVAGVGNLLGRPAAAATIYVAPAADQDPGPNDWGLSDPLEDGSLEHPYDELQEAVDWARPGDVVVVLWGLNAFRNGELWIDKDVTIRSLDPNVVAFVESTSLLGTVVFAKGTSPACVLEGFSFVGLEVEAIRGYDSEATVRRCIFMGNRSCSGNLIKGMNGLFENCLIADNVRGGSCGLLPLLFQCAPILRNCTIVNNVAGLYLRGGLIENCIVRGNGQAGDSQMALVPGAEVVVQYSNVAGWASLRSAAGVVAGEGMMDRDPNFVQYGIWVEEDGREILIPGDYHLKCRGWRWMGDQDGRWIQDDRTSYCIDAGNPETPLGNESYSDRQHTDMVYAEPPEGGWNPAINMGFYGGTQEASVLPDGQTPALSNRETPGGTVGVLTPDPPQWAPATATRPSGAPRAVLAAGGSIWSDYRIEMAVIPVNNSAGNPVFYMFDCSDPDANFDSGWISSPFYVKDKLSRNTARRLQYRVKARDDFGNETQWSEWTPVVFD